ncbi:MAG: tRNA-modifying protein YgfZ [Fluviibacter phosphoraccumulans EoVTN8]
MTTPQFIALPHLAILDVTGEDAQNFLHAQVPSDIRTLNAESAQISGWCTAKGRLLTTFIIWTIENGYRLVLAADVRDAIAKRLKMYVMRLKVQVAPSSDVVYGLLNPEPTLNNQALPSVDWQLTHLDRVTIVRLDSTRDLLTGPESDLQTLAATNNTTNPVLWMLSDIAQGFPLVTQASSEHYVPQMVNLDKLGGVSFKKGCYPGQEIVARTHYLGKIKRHLYRVSSAQPIVTGTEVRSNLLNGQACGSLLTTAQDAQDQWQALAVLQQDAIEGAIYLQTDSGEQALHLIDRVLPDEDEAQQPQSS